MTNPAFNPGFRLSAMDILIMIGGMIAAAFASKFSTSLAAACLFVVGHFFIFCNIVRMSRIPELIWATTFTLLFVFLSATHLTLVLAFSLFLMLTLVLLETKKPSYHGIFWQKINPNLPAWFEEQFNAKLLDSERV